jgi:glycosyltransferase involved in cell wall biosynthesis
MKIAQIAPLAESCPPKLYGGTERIVSYLTEELVRLGHDVTLFASGDSITDSKLVPCSTRALRLDAKVRDMTPYYVMMLDEVHGRLDDFDVLHFHIDHLHYSLMRPFSDRMLTTLHGRLGLPDLPPFYSRSMSDAGKLTANDGNEAKTGGRRGNATSFSATDQMGIGIPLRHAAYSGSASIKTCM